MKFVVDDDDDDDFAVNLKACTVQLGVWWNKCASRYTALVYVINNLCCF